MVTFFVRLRDHRAFSGTVTMAIFVAGILVGLQTYESLQKNNFIKVLDLLILLVFVAEIVVKIGAEGKYPWRYFHNSWNMFDFYSVNLLLAFDGNNAAAVFRLLRLLRIFKLVKALPKLRMLVMGLVKSLSSIVYIFLLMFIASFCLP